jgi:hypothetical protein
MPLPTDSKERKAYPMYEGLLKYFPDALAAVAHLSWVGNQKHNPGEPLHWAKEKSTDHADCILRHLVDAQKAQDLGLDAAELEELAAVAWRALALWQSRSEAILARSPVNHASPYAVIGGDVAGPQHGDWRCRDYNRNHPDVYAPTTAYDPDREV